ncbi:synaptic vesicular amine transporter [Anopheles sinensis]|uniref:Synaptic vesicular amine transporter n=1 Tax=Anopheles sinensis TaxID=74873 RepID=A0A084VY62_ANOSI|nr:synaptic vesicular amine transporter [Anopheles sinensis]
MPVTFLDVLGMGSHPFTVHNQHNTQHTTTQTPPRTSRGHGEDIDAEATEGLHFTHFRAPAANQARRNVNQSTEPAHASKPLVKSLLKEHMVRGLVVGRGVKGKLLGNLFIGEVFFNFPSSPVLLHRDVA